MSYILEALRKSDQMRQRGATPSLQASQVTATAPKRPYFIYYSLFAAALLGAGVMIGWLRPLQTDQPPLETTVPGAETAVSPFPMPLQAAPAPLQIQPEVAGAIEKRFPALKSKPAVRPVPDVDVMQPEISAPAGTPGEAPPMPEMAMPEKVMSEEAVPETAFTEEAGSPAEMAQAQSAIPMTELPLHIQQEIPPMEVQLHAYSSNPGERLVSINSIRLREGGLLSPDLKLEQITQDGMIFSYKGYRFQRGVR